MAQAVIYAGSNCSGDATKISIDTSDEHCFTHGGNSFKDLYYNCSFAFEAFLAAWSGDNCEGSDTVFDAPISPSGNCVDIPFSSVELLLVDGDI